MGKTQVKVLTNVIAQAAAGQKDVMPPQTATTMYSIASNTLRYCTNAAAHKKNTGCPHF
jgi:hypothetical protein